MTARLLRARLRRLGASGAAVPPEHERRPAPRGDEIPPITVSSGGVDQTLVTHGGSLRRLIDGPRATGAGSEECRSEEQLGPGEIGQPILHSCANCLPRTARDPLFYGAEGPPQGDSELR